MSSSAPAISVRNLSKHFGRVKAVDGLDLDVPRGSCFGFIGPNGAGKTTFIKLLLGVARPASGEIRIMEGSPEDPAVRKRIGYLPERLALPPAFTPRTFLTGVGRLKGLARTETEQQLSELLEQVGLEREAWSRPIGKFSKGMRQRTGLAAALLGQPDLLVLDEPTDGIDPIGRGQIRKVIRDAHARGVTVFLNSHLLAETEKLCDHVAIVGHGRVLRSGGMADLRAEDRFLVRFEPRDGLDDSARAAGLVPSEEAQTLGRAGEFHFEGRSPAEMSAAVKMVLDAGHTLLEVSPRLRDLEDVLAEAVHDEAGPKAGGAA